MGIKGKVVVITGANGGLGSKITQAFLTSGATVVGVSRSIEQADFSGEKFRAIAADIGDPKQTREVVSKVISEFGRIDVLVHVVGGFSGGGILDTSDETWNRMLALNLNSAFFITREVVRSMQEHGGGRLIAIGSLAATEPHPGLGAYVVSKSAMATLFRTIALESREAGITANVILPGTMDTPGNRAAMPDADPGKWVHPEDVASVALYLASDEASTITGALIPVYSRAV